MTTTSMGRIVVPALIAAPLIALVGALGYGVVFGIQYALHAPSVDTIAATEAPASPQPESAAQDQHPPALAEAQAQANDVVATLGGSLPPDSSAEGVPAFDVARIEPSGEAVIAGRAAPGATVELLRNGEVHDRAVADQAGQFVMVPPRLPAGTYDLTLRARQADGKETTSKQSVTVALEAKAAERPVVALMTPDKPTVVLSQPAAAKPAPGTVVVEAVETEPGGKLHVSGRARSGGALRLYLNDSFIASVTADGDGRFAVTINEGVRPGSYRVRLDEAEATSGAVRARAEVPFNVPDTFVTGSVTAAGSATKRPEAATGQGPQLAAAAATATEQKPSEVVVPRVTTTTVSRGDSLWRLSHLAYGAGTRYAVIYKANRQQIRNPNLIYPGQIFVLPSQ